MLSVDDRAPGLNSDVASSTRRAGFLFLICLGVSLLAQVIDYSQSISPLFRGPTLRRSVLFETLLRLVLWPGFMAGRLLGSSGLGRATFLAPPLLASVFWTMAFSVLPRLLERRRSR